MKKTFLLFALSLVYALSIAQNGFPTRNVGKTRDRFYVEKITGNSNTIPGTTLGQSPRVQSGANNSVRIFTALDATPNPATITANQWASVTPIELAGAGRQTIIYKIKFFVSKDCWIALEKSAASNLSGAWGTWVERQRDTTGGVVTFDFTDNPMVVNWGETLQFLYTRGAKTGGMSWTVIVESTSVSNCQNLDAPFEVGFMGDSFCNVWATGEREYTVNDAGVETGSWTILVQKYLKRNGIDTYRSNIGQGGSDTAWWLQKVQNGLFRMYRPDIICSHLGINDGATSIQTGALKANYKAIIREYFDNVPNGCFVALSLEDISNPATVATGDYAGQTTLVAGRTIIAQVVSELKAENPTWDLVLANTIPANTYTTSNTDHYVETVPGTYVHPNLAKGQPKIATPVKSAIATTAFFNKYKKP